MSGWFVEIWGDGLTYSEREALVKYFLIDDSGTWNELHIGNGVYSLDEVSALDRTRVNVTGHYSPNAIFVVSDIAPDRMNPKVNPNPQLVAKPEAVVGTKKFVTILCRFADSPSEPPVPPSYYSGLMSNTYPGLDHYWREASYGTINLGGSIVVGWYRLPNPKSYYVYDANGDGIPDLDFFRLTEGAATVADPDVFFPEFFGVNFVYEDDTVRIANGGGTFLTRDGVSQLYGSTWINTGPGALHQTLFAHEMGHAFGLPHSSGSYGQIYDSRWDVMSIGYGFTDPTYVRVGTGTISYHKDILGWIQPDR